MLKPTHSGFARAELVADPPITGTLGDWVYAALRNQCVVPHWFALRLAEDVEDYLQARDLALVHQPRQSR